MGAENAETEVGKVSLGIELTTESVASQAPKVEKAVEKVAQKAGEKAGEKISEETAKGIEKGSSKAEKAGEEAGRKAGKGTRKGIAHESGDISSESGNTGEKAGKSFFSRFQKHASGEGGGLKAIAAKVGKTLAAAFAAKKIFDFGKQAIDLGSDLNEVQNVVDSTFGEKSREQINDFSKNAATQFGLSETMAKRYAGTFKAMGNAFQIPEDAATEMSMKLTGLAGDVASFYNMSQDEAFTKLKSVFTGETESLKELGVVMTQSALDQFALQNGFGQTTRSMSEQEKVALRYRFVLEKLSNASNDFVRTSGGWANQVRLLKLQFESLAATVGQVLIAALTPAIRALNTFMGALIKAANTFKSFVFSLFGLESQDMGTGAGSALPDALGDISSGASDASDALGDVGDAATGAGNDAAAAANEIKRSLASFDKITKLSDSSSSGGSSGGGGGSGSGGSGSSGGSGGSASLGDTSSALTNTAYSVASSNGPLDKIMQKIQALKDLFVNGFWEGLGDTAVFDSIRSNIEGIGKNLKEIFTDPKVLEAASNCADKIAENLGKVVGSVVSIGATIADNLTGGFNKYLEQHKEDIKNFIVSVFNITGDIADVIGNFAASFADVFSVFRSDEAKQITADIINIFATGFGTVIETALKFARDVISNLTKPFTDNKDQIKQVLEDALEPISTIVSTISDTVSTIGRYISKLYDEHVKPLLDSFGDGISDLVSTFLDGWTKHIQPVLEALSKKIAEVFEDKVQPMIESVGEAVGSILDVVKSLWESILQPLCKWIIDNIMPILADLLEGIGKTFLDAVSTTADVIKGLADGFKTLADWIKKVIDFAKNFDMSKVTKGLKDITNGAKNLPGQIVIKAKAILDKGWNSVVSAFDKLKNSTVVKTVKAAVQKTFTAAKAAWEAVKSGAVIKTVKGKIQDTFTSLKKAWAAIKTHTVTKTIEAAPGKLWNSLKSAWVGIKNSTAVKTVSAKAEKIFNTVKKAWDSIKDGSAVKNVKAKVESGWNSVVDKWGKLKSQTVSVVAKVTGTLKDLGTWWKEKKPTNWTITGTVKGALTGLWDWWKEHKPSNWSITGTVKGTLEGLWDWWKNHKPSNWSITSTVKGSTDGLTSWWKDHKPSNWEIVAKVKGAADGLASWWKSHKPSLSDLTAKIKLHAPSIHLNWATKSFGPLGSIKYPTGFSVHAKGGIFDSASMLGVSGDTMHIAGEAGKEALLPLDRHTEWMDKVAKRVIVQQQNKGVFNMDDYLPRLADIGNGIRSDTAQLVTCARQAREAADGGRTAEMIELLKKILQILMELDPDIYIDGQKVTARIVSIINAQTRATGKSAIIV